MTRVDVDRYLTISRRTWLKGIGASALLTTSAPLFAGRVWAQPIFRHYPFSLGVASGDPTPTGTVLWTRIAPEPFHGGGMPNKAVEVEWQVASDERMRQVVQRGKVIAHPELGHSVHVEVEGLEPARDYFYRFAIGGEQSRIGRTRTMPPAASAVAQVRFGVAGCQRYEDGYFTAFKHIADERFDFVYHYGDYIYEYRHVDAAERATFARAMPEPYDEIYTLVDYRNRYAVHTADPDLLAARASAPFLSSFDDHEVDNNYAGDNSEETAEKVPPELFRLRRAAAFQAWYENMPVRRTAFPRGPDITAYRRLGYGNLLAINVLDTRQYRSDQPCGDGIRANCAEALAPDRTMLGEVQERWLYDGFRASQARWNVLAQQVIVMRNDRDPDPSVLAPSMDKWDGAVAARNRLFAAMAESRLSNPVVLTGDIHNNWAGELKADFDQPSSPTLGVEFVATSITSGGNGADVSPETPAILSQNPHIKFFNNQRGYVRHVVTPDRWQADFRVLDRVSVRGEPVKTRRSFVVEAGRPVLAEA
jgi:alkaline phosphatase D